MKTLQASLNSLITEYHRLYANFRRPEYLEIATDLGKVDGTDFNEIWDRIAVDKSQVLVEVV